VFQNLNQNSNIIRSDRVHHEQINIGMESQSISDSSAWRTEQNSQSSEQSYEMSSDQSSEQPPVDQAQEQNRQ